jgi:hypothetical protein
LKSLNDTYTSNAYGGASTSVGAIRIQKLSRDLQPIMQTDKGARKAIMHRKGATSPQVSSHVPSMRRAKSLGSHPRCARTTSVETDK